MAQNGAHTAFVVGLWVAGLVFATLIVIFSIALYNTQASAQRPQNESPADPQVAITRPTPTDEHVPPGVFGVNFALTSNGATITGGKRPELLIDGDSTHYDGSRGFGYTVWRKTPLESFVVEFKEPSEIDCIRFLLWDMEENRFYRYKLEVSDSATEKDWTVVSDKTGKMEECQSWQVIRFAKRPVKSIRLTGTYNSANSEFHVVELQALMAPPNGFPPDPKTLPPQTDTVPQEHLEF